MTDKEKKIDSIKNFSMFYPRTKNGLLYDYPELRKIESFEKLNRTEMLFVWFYACKASPFSYEEDEKVKIEEALKASYGRSYRGVFSKYVVGDFPEKTRAAIADMRKFEVGPRVKAKMMVEKIMQNYEEIIDVDVRAEFINKDGDVDWTKKKAYVDACATIATKLPMLIGQAEGSFGISVKEEGDTSEEEIVFDDIVDDINNG